jgi:hypothetical protein
MKRNFKLFFKRSLHTASIVLGLSATALAHATTGIFQDQGGAVFNVKAYGAVGNGTTFDSASIQSAIDAATTAGGGIVYFPVGTYLIDATLQLKRSDMVSLVGSGMASQLRFTAALGIDLPAVAQRPEWQFHSGSISNMKLVCASTPRGTAVRMTDIIAAPKLDDLFVSDCNVGFDLSNQKAWTERLVVEHVTDDRNKHLFHFNNNPSSAFNSYGYGIYNGIYINKVGDQDVFYLTGGAYLYHSSFVIKGNFGDAGGSIFNVQGSSGQPCPGAAYNTFDIAVEGLPGYDVVRAAGNGCSGGPTGNPLVGGTGTVSAIHSNTGTSSWIRALASVPFRAGALTTTAASSDSLPVPSGITPDSVCFAQPANATAAQIVNGTYVSGTNWGVVTVTHPAVAGATFQIWCQ